MSLGILDRDVASTPIAIVDLETTGLNAGVDRVVEISVIRMEPGAEPVLAFDTLVNPQRPMAATEIHGITDDDVADAPEFADIATHIMNAISECVVAAYNVYFDMRFLDYEITRARLRAEAPHFCLMYLRPMLGLGGRCSLFG
jgi:DNA polymerase III epsilon subunit family exonuclease